MNASGLGTYLKQLTTGALLQLIHGWTTEFCPAKKTIINNQLIISLVSLIIACYFKDAYQLKLPTAG